MKIGDRITAIIGPMPGDCRTGTVTHLLVDLLLEYVPIDWVVDGAARLTGHRLLRSEEGVAWISGDDPARIAALRVAYALSRKGPL